MRKVVLAIVVAIAISISLFSSSFIRPASGNQAPVASFSYSPQTPMPEEIIVFDASSSHDPDGSIISYLWDFGDGAVVFSSSPMTIHVYLVDGRYTVQLTVTDNSGAKNYAVAVIEVSTVIFFRVVFYGTLVALPNAKVTAYYKSGAGYVPAPVGPHKLEIKYDNMTQPDQANTAEESYRNPGITASIPFKNASNIGFDIHPSGWIVYFKFEWATYTAYWPNETTRVYTYDDGAIFAHDYLPGHSAYWDPAASTYVIRAGDIPGGGVSPTGCTPIIVGVLCPPPPVQYYLTVNTDPVGITAIPGEGWYNHGTNVGLTAPSLVESAPGARYRFSYWDIDGSTQGEGVDPINVLMNANHTATAHYVLQYSVTFGQNGLTSDATGIVVTVNGSAKTYSNLSYTIWADFGGTATYSFNSPVTSTVTGKRYVLTSITGPMSPITVSMPITVIGNYDCQYLVTFTHSGLDSTSTGTVLTVNGTSKTYSNLPHSLWSNTGDSLIYSCSPTVTSSTTGKRFRLVSVSGPASPIAVTGPATVTGNYVVQYLATFTQTGLDSTSSGTVVTVNGNPQTCSSLPYSIWFDSGASATYNYADPVLSSTSGKRFRITSVTGPVSPITISGPVTVIGNYKTQYEIVFDQSGVGTDFTGSVVTIDSVNYVVSNLPTYFWWDASSGHTFSYSSPLIVNASKQYSWISTSGLTSMQSGSLTTSTSGSVIGNYIVQNCVTFDQLGASSDFAGTVLTVDGTPYGVSNLPFSMYWQIGSVHTFSFQSPLIVTANNKQYLWTSTTGLSTLQGGSITVTSFGSIVGNYKTQYYLNLTTNPPGIASPSGGGWYDAGTYASISTQQYVMGGSRYWFINWTTVDMWELTNFTSPSTTALVDKAKTVTAYYVHQFLITFAQTGVGNDYSSTIVTVDATPYGYSSLPVAFWWDNGSVHTFAYNSPLIVNMSKQYLWTSTTGLSTFQNGSITTSSSGTVAGSYMTQGKCQVTFGQTGIAGDFTGTIVTVDGTNYDGSELPALFWWDSGSTHSFSFSSPLTPSSDKRYVWISTSGLSTQQSSSFTIINSGSVVGNYRTQYHLTLVSYPVGIATPTGAGWCDANTNATISTQAFVDIVPGSSRYRFNGWTTTNMTEIGDPTRSPTTVLMDETKTVTANYVAQYAIVVSQSGVSADFAGTIVGLDSVDHNVTVLPTTLWWDNDTVHSFDFKSPLTVTPNAKRYVWVSTAGLSTKQSDLLVINGSGSITGNYVTQYHLTVSTSPPGLVSIPGEGWYNHSTGVALNAPPVLNYNFAHWIVDGVQQTPGMSTINLAMSTPHTAQAVYTPIVPYVLAIITTTGGSTNPTPGTYAYSQGQTVLVTALPSSGYILEHWEFDGTNVSASANPYLVTMNTNHTLKAVFQQAPSPPSVTIDPMLSTIYLGQSVHFTSLVSGGASPYSYQWYLNGGPVQGATSSTFAFTPASGGIDFIHVKVTDALNNIVYSSPAKVTVTMSPVGGETVSLGRKTSIAPTAVYMTLMCLFLVVLAKTKRKRK